VCLARPDNGGLVGRRGGQNVGALYLDLAQDHCVLAGQRLADGLPAEAAVEDNHARGGGAVQERLADGRERQRGELGQVVPRLGDAQVQLEALAADQPVTGVVEEQQVFGLGRRPHERGTDLRHGCVGRHHNAVRGVESTQLRIREHRLEVSDVPRDDRDVRQIRVAVGRRPDQDDP
jgi:hypothetical protein